MPGYNKNFELSVNDLDLIEDALLRKKRDLSTKPLREDSDDLDLTQLAEEMDDRVRDIHDLLGRIHNQKIFYRPKDAVYIGG